MRLTEQAKKTLNRNDKKPLYKQLYTLLKQEILSGEIQVGDRFYSEYELLEIYDVSRTTVRLALKELEDEGFVSRSQGNPTIVTDRSKYTWNLNDLTDDLRRLKERLKTTVLSVRRVDVTKEIRENLQLDKSVKTVFELVRLREVQDRKMAVSISYFPIDFPLDKVGVEEGDDFSVKKFLKSIGKNPYIAEETLGAVNAPSDICKLLDLPENHAVFLRKRITFDCKDYPLEFVVSYYNPKNSQYYVRNRIL